MTWYNQFNSVTQSCPHSLQPHGLQRARLPYPSPTLRAAQTHVHRVSKAIQTSHPLSPPSPSDFSLSQHHGFFFPGQFFTSGGQSIRASASALVLPMNLVYYE